MRFLRIHIYDYKTPHKKSANPGRAVGVLYRYINIKIILLQTHMSESRPPPHMTSKYSKRERANAKSEYILFSLSIFGYICL